MVLFALAGDLGFGLGLLCAFLKQPRLPGLLPSHLDIGRIDTLVCRRTDATCTDTEHQSIVDDIAIETRVVALQTLCCDAVVACDALACVLLSTLVNELTVVSVATEAELGANLEGVTVSAGIEQIEGEDLVG